MGHVETAPGASVHTKAIDAVSLDASHADTEAAADSLPTSVDASEPLPALDKAAAQRQQEQYREQYQDQWAQYYAYQQQQQQPAQSHEEQWRRYYVYQQRYQQYHQSTAYTQQVAGGKFHVAAASDFSPNSLETGTNPLKEAEEGGATLPVPEAHLLPKLSDDSV